MYEEKRERFSIKDLLIQLLFIVLVIFILIWLFPTKGDIKNSFSGTNTEFDVLTNRIFNDNLQTMKEAALFYYTTPRLPKEVDDVESMTLREMLDKKLLIEFKDANNKSCDLDESYVEITKLEDEFVLKVNLRCTDNDAYILVHIGCYDYCTTAVCENKEENPPIPIINEPKPEETCSYKYQKVIANEIWSEWSEWTTEAITQTETKQVETKNEYTTGTKDVTLYKEETFEDKTKPIIKNILVPNGEPITATYCSSYKTQTTPTGEKLYEWIDEGTSYYTKQPANTGTTRYEYVGVTTVDCDKCDNGIYYIYRKYTLKVSETVTEKEVCDSWSTASAYVYMIQPKLIGYETSIKKTPYVEQQTYTITTTYYRYRTLTTTYTTLTEWSSSSNDKNLISQGYEYITSVCK